MTRATGQFADLVSRELVLARPGEPEAGAARDAWFVTKLVMAVFHHYAFAELDADPAVIADDLWAFCGAALREGDPTARISTRTTRGD